MSAPANINSCVISAVTTFPAAIVALGHLSLSLFTESTNLMVYPFATSRPIKPELAFDNFDMSSMPPNQHIFGWPVLNSLEFFLR